jgi:hypothetical protein
MVESNSRPAQGDRVVNTTSGEHSGNSNLDLVSLHRESLTRDRNDITKNTQAMGDDRTSMGDAREIMKVNNQVIHELLDHGQVSPQTLDRAAKLHNKANADNATDARESREYAGTNPPDEKSVASAAQLAREIGGLSKLLTGTADPDQETAILTRMGTNAKQIADLGKGDPSVIGKDASDAGKEAAVIQGDLEKLATMDRSSPLYKQLVQDIGSKSGLIQRELGDIKDEQGYIAHDASDTGKNNAVLDAVRQLQNSGPMDWKTTESFIETFQQDNESKRQTVAARRDDLKAEPDYNDADRKDARLNAQIMRWLGESPYPNK